MLILYKKAQYVSSLINVYSLPELTSIAEPEEMASEYLPLSDFGNDRPGSGISS